MVLATLPFYYPDEHTLFRAVLYSSQISPLLTLLFVLALAALYAQFKRLPAGRSPSSLSLATAGVVLAGSGLLLITVATASEAWAVGVTRTCVSVTNCNVYDPSYYRMLYNTLATVGILFVAVGLVLLWLTIRRARLLPRTAWALALAGVMPLLTLLFGIVALILVPHPDWAAIIDEQLANNGLGIVWALSWMVLGVGLLAAQPEPEAPGPRLALQAS
jgi:hypothetical protein